MESQDLIEAVLTQDDIDLTTILNQGGTDLEYKDSEGRTGLFMAAQNGYYHGLELLISHGGNIESKNDTGHSPLHIAAENGNIPEAKLLIDHNANVNSRENTWGSSPLMCATLFGYDVIVDCLLSAGADPDLRAVFGYAAISIGAFKGYVKIVRKLLRHGGSDVELKTANGATPLLLAAGAWHLKVIQPLLEYGADVNVQDNAGMGLLHILAGFASPELITSLITTHHAKLDLQDEKGCTALHIATTENNLANVKAFVRAGFDVNMSDKAGNTVLHVAAMRGLPDILSFLMTLEIDANVENAEGFKPIDCAHLSKHGHLVEMLKRVSELSKDIDTKSLDSIRSSTPTFARSLSAPVPAPRSSRSRKFSNVSLPPGIPQVQPRSRACSTSAAVAPCPTVSLDTKNPFSATSIRSSYLIPIPSSEPSDLSTFHNKNIHPRKKADYCTIASEPVAGTKYKEPSEDFQYCGNAAKSFNQSVPVATSVSPHMCDADFQQKRDSSLAEHEHAPLGVNTRDDVKVKRKGGFASLLPNRFKPNTKKRQEKNVPLPKSGTFPNESSVFHDQKLNKIKKELEKLQISPTFKETIAEVYIPYDRLVMGDLIGRGNFGRVYAGQLKTADANFHKVAVKTAKNNAGDIGVVETFLKEALMMKDLEHMHVLNLIGITFDLEQNPMAIIPFMAHGNLRAFIGDRGRDLIVKNLLSLGLQVGRGMQYLSLKKFIHRDLACRNCMIDEHAIVKVADFGLSRDLFSRDYYRISDKTVPLPVRWMAPESLQEHKFVQQSDVWSYGVLLWELLTRGDTPYNDVENWDIARYIRQGNRLGKPEYCPSSVYDVMQSCWQATPETRPAFKDIVTAIEDILHDLTVGSSMDINPADRCLGQKVYFV